jgi:hypothetical protein
VVAAVVVITRMITTDMDQAQRLCVTGKQWAAKNAILLLESL